MANPAAGSTAAGSTAAGSTAAGFLMPKPYGRPRGWAPADTASGAIHMASP